MTRRCVTDEQYAALDRRLDEVKRRVDEGTLPFQATMDCLQTLVEGKFAVLANNLSAVIATCHFDWVNPNIERTFILEPVRRERKVFRFNRSVSSEDAVEQMAREGWSPANLAELLDYAKTEWDGREGVVALGSSTGVGKSRASPILRWTCPGRELNLFWWNHNWDPYERFLAARN